ncbi:SAM-dependent methyltransferase [Pseudonocardia sp. DLS-67]
MEPAEINTSVPQSARIWNYWLGGKDDYAADRAAGDEVMARIPDIADGARAAPPEAGLAGVIEASARKRANPARERVETPILRACGLVIGDLEQARGSHTDIRARTPTAVRV